MRNLEAKQWVHLGVPRHRGVYLEVLRGILWVPSNQGVIYIRHICV